MSFIRLLALSYLAWAAVFVVTVILVAHLPLPGDRAAGNGAAVQIGRNAMQPSPDKTQSHAVARLELAPVARLDLAPLAPLAGPPEPSVLAPSTENTQQTASSFHIP